LEHRPGTVGPHWRMMLFETQLSKLMLVETALGLEFVESVQ
jgi:hypothetical protein